jgi:hypothetical protein
MLSCLNFIGLAPGISLLYPAQWLRWEGLAQAFSTRRRSLDEQIVPVADVPVVTICIAQVAAGRGVAPSQQAWLPLSPIMQQRISVRQIRFYCAIYLVEI